MDRKFIIKAVFVIFLIALALISTYNESGIWKEIANLFLSIGTIYGTLKQFFPKSAIIIFTDSILIRTPFALLLEANSKEDEITDSQGFNVFKQKLLEFTTSEIEKRNTIVINPDIFCFDFFNFEGFSTFNPGSSQVNKFLNWEKDNYIERQFSFITGDAGSGKTFELIKRAEHACKLLSKGLTNDKALEGIKIPIYIELKSLDREFSNEWIINYLEKTSQIAGDKLDGEQLKKLIKKGDVLYFFDGVDEIDIRFREDCVKKIVDKFTKTATGITVTCRKQFYDLFEKNNQIIPPKYRPAELWLQPLDIKLILNIINELPKKTQLEIKKRDEMINFIIINTHVDLEALINIIHELPNRTLDQKSKMIQLAINNQKENREGNTLLGRLSQSIFLNLFMIIFPRLSDHEKEELASGEMDVLWRNYEDIIAKKKLPKDVDILGLRTYTVWIAKIMKQSPFNVESIQPNWLWEIINNKSITPSLRIQRLYYVCTRILSSIIVGIAMGCILATPFALIPTSILGGFTISALAGIYNYKRITTGVVTETKEIWVVIKKGLFTLSMIIALVLVCGTYQGISIPRHPDEMTYAHFSMAECWSGILLGICLSTIFSYRIIMENDKQKYILPVEIFHFDWGHAFKYGLSWGGATGLIAGSIAVYVKNHFKSHIFIKSWLIPYINHIVVDRGGNRLSERDQDLAIFIYAFLVAFFVASIVIVLMAGRFNDIEEQDVKKKQELNFGIIESGKQAIIHGFKIALLGCAIYYLIMLRAGTGNLYFCLKIAFGISVLSFLWFGGMEVINHRFLRFDLYIRRIAPLDYKLWVQAFQNMGLLIPSGYQLKFYHTTLTDYYLRYDIENNPRIRIKNKNYNDILIYMILLFLFSNWLVSPLLKQYVFHSFARNEYDINTHFQGVVKNVADLNHSYCVTRDGVYKLTTSGYTNVGTFVGYVLPKGTQYGFMGMPIDSAYNIRGFGKYRHAALLYRVQFNSGNWSKFGYASEKDTLHLKKNDRLEFLVNDKEYQNNLGRYLVELTPLLKNDK